MGTDIQIHTDPAIDVEGALVIVGAPGLGFVGSITTRYLVEELKMQRIGGLHSAEFPPYVPVEKGRPLHPVRLHHLETTCGLDLDCDRVIVLTSELFSGPRMVHPLSVALVAWARKIKASLMLVPDAMAAGDEQGGIEGVRGIGATERALEILRRADVEPLPEGVIAGLTAGLLSESERQGLDTAAILVESAPDHPDARAAARLVEVLDVVLPGIKLESEPLLKRAEEIEEAVKSIRAQMAQQASQETSSTGAPATMSMFH